MKTVTICGSMRFEKQMQEIALELEAHHQMNVLQCVYNPSERPLSEEELSALTAAHYRKIDLSDGIYVVDIGGYVGESVRREIHYAQKQGKVIFFHSRSRQNKNRTDVSVLFCYLI